MVKLSLKKESFVLIMLTVLLAGCGDDVQTEDTAIPDMSVQSEEETQIADDSAEGSTTEELLQPSFAKMT